MNLVTFSFWVEKFDVSLTKLQMSDLWWVYFNTKTPKKGNLETRERGYVS